MTVPAHRKVIGVFDIATASRKLLVIGELKLASMRLNDA
jgi:hypothetical protein